MKWPSLYSRRRKKGNYDREAERKRIAEGMAEYKGEIEKLPEGCAVGAEHCWQPLWMDPQLPWLHNQRHGKG